MEFRRYMLGSKVYGPGVDMWACGCIFAELMLRKPYFPGSSDIDQLGRIYSGLGTPCEESWPGFKHLPDYVEFVSCPAPPLRQLFVSAPPDALHLLHNLLAFDPNRLASCGPTCTPRPSPSAVAALSHTRSTAYILNSGPPYTRCLSSA